MTVDQPGIEHTKKTVDLGTLDVGHVIGVIEIAVRQLPVRYASVILHGGPHCG